MIGSCVMMARSLCSTSYDAYGPRAGAIIAVLGGRCAERTASMADNVVEVAFAPKLSPAQRVEEALRELAEMRVTNAAAIRDDRRWRNWERRILFARIRQLREELRAERVNQFDDAAVYAAAREIQGEAPGDMFAAKVVAARLLRAPTHSATVRVGLALSRLERAGRLRRARSERSRTYLWQIVEASDDAC